MQKSQLVQLFLSFSREEKIACRKFVHSSYHNQREDVRFLYDYMGKNYAKNWQLLRKEAVFAALFPDQPFDDKRMRYTMSFLLKCLENFLIQQAQEKRGGERDLLLAQAYQEKQLNKGVQQALKRARQRTETPQNRDISYYAHCYQLENSQYEFTTGQDRNTQLNVTNWSQALDHAFLAKKLRQSCFALAHQSVYKIEYDTGLLPVIIDYLEQQSWLDEHPAIALYYYFYRALTSEDHHTYFQKLKKGILASIQVFPAKEQYNLYLTAINYCIQRFNKGEEAYVQEVFELYQSGLEKEILLENGVISRYTFKNIAGIALRLGEFTWTEYFIEHYQSKLAPRYRTNYVHYNISKLHYSQKRYEEAMLRLQRVEYDDLFLNLDAKVMLLKMYYELGEWEVLDSLITSFRSFLSRKKAIGYHYENYRNIIRFTRKLLEVNHYDKNAKQQLKEEILATSALAERKWLVAQLDQSTN